MGTVDIYHCQTGARVDFTLTDVSQSSFYDASGHLTGIVMTGRAGKHCYGKVPADGCVQVGEEVNCAESFPLGHTNVGDASVSGGGVNNSARVVAGMQAGFRACYNQGLRTNPDMQGSVLVTAHIESSGEVGSATASQIGSISETVAGCIAARAKSAQFDPPDGGAATIAIPITLVPQQKSDEVK